MTPIVRTALPRFYRPGRTRVVSAVLTAATIVLRAAACAAQTPSVAMPDRNEASSEGVTAPAPPGAEALNAAAEYSVRHSGRAFLVMHHGRVLLERYDNGWTAQRPHPLASGTKSFTGVLAMLAVQDGLLTLDEHAGDTLTEWKSDPRKSAITIRHLLTLSSGLDSAERAFGIGRGDRHGSRVLGEMTELRAERLGLDGSVKPDNWNLTALAVPMVSDAGEQFRYGPSHFFVFSEVLNRKLAAAGGPQTSTMDYLRDRLLKPLGIEVARIGRDRAGNPNLPGGMLLTAREWAKFGQFVLDDGAAADGRRLLAPELLAECFRPSSTNPRYGLTWWLPTPDRDVSAAADAPDADTADASGGNAAATADGPAGDAPRIFMAAGLGKQRLYVIPDRGLVIVRFAEATRDGRRFSDAELLALLLK